MIENVDNIRFVVLQRVRWLEADNLQVEILW